MANLIALALATAVLVMIPGPNVALIVANSLRYGFSSGAMTALGITLGNAVQLLAVVVGLSALVEMAADALTWIRWCGVVYLLYLGVRTWREPPGDISHIKARPTMFWRGLMIAAVNPKTLLFIAAFLPQFVIQDGSIAGQLSVVGGVFLAVLRAGDLVWAMSAASSRRLFERFARVRNRITGGVLVAAGVGLALARR